MSLFFVHTFLAERLNRPKREQIDRNSGIGNEIRRRTARIKSRAGNLMETPPPPGPCSKKGATGKVRLKRLMKRSCRGNEKKIFEAEFQKYSYSPGGLSASDTFLKALNFDTSFPPSTSTFYSPIFKRENEKIRSCPLVITCSLLSKSQHAMWD